MITRDTVIGHRLYIVPQAWYDYTDVSNYLSCYGHNSTWTWYLGTVARTRVRVCLSVRILTEESSVSVSVRHVDTSKAVFKDLLSFSDRYFDPGARSESGMRRSHAPCTTMVVLVS